MLTVGQAAEQAGVNIEALRYYERKRVLPEPVRSDSNYRLYTQDTVRRIRFIKRVQELGFSLKEVEELLTLRATRDARCDGVRSRAEVKIREIASKIRGLESMRAALGDLVRECETRRGMVSECPILDALDTVHVDCNRSALRNGLLFWLPKKVGQGMCRRVVRDSARPGVPQSLALGSSRTGCRCDTDERRIG